MSIENYFTFTGLNLSFKDSGDLEMVDPIVDPVDENLHLYDDLRAIHNKLVNNQIIY